MATHVALACGCRAARTTIRAPGSNEVVLLVSLSMMPTTGFDLQTSWTDFNEDVSKALCLFKPHKLVCLHYCKQCDTVTGPSDDLLLPLLVQNSNHCDSKQLEFKKWNAALALSEPFVTAVGVKANIL
jgi:hypothetical protein